MKTISTGHALFAATMIGLGILGFVKGDFGPAFQPVPKWLPARAELAYLSAGLSLLCGMGLFWNRAAGAAARVLLVYLLLVSLLFKGRFIYLQPTVEGSYQTCGENAVLVAAAWVLYAGFAPEWDRRRLAFATGERGLRIARVLYGLAMVAFGLSHLVYINLTAPLVPAWLPWHTGFGYFTGLTYLAAAVAIPFGVWARLAAVLSTAQMAGFTLLVWVPLAMAGAMSPSQWGELIISWALTAGGWVVADSYRDTGWLAVGQRQQRGFARA
jgi:uncharacterized membrane protein